MPLLILFLILLLGCTTSNGHIEGIRYTINKAIYIDESYFDNVSYSEKCQEKLNELKWDYSQSYEECPHLFYGQKDISKFRLNIDGTSLCDEKEKCLAKPDIFISEKNVSFSFCQSKFFTKMTYDNLGEIHDFDNYGLKWRGPYTFSKTDSTIIFKGKNGMKMIFFIEENKSDFLKNFSIGKDVTKYLQKPYGIVNDTICTTKNLIIY